MSTINFDVNDLGYLRASVRNEIGRCLKGRERLTNRYGDSADLARIEARIDFLNHLYVKLGGNPASVTVEHP